MLAGAARGFDVRRAPAPDTAGPGDALSRRRSGLGRAGTGREPQPRGRVPRILSLRAPRQGRAGGRARSRRSPGRLRPLPRSTAPGGAGHWTSLGADLVFWGAATWGPTPAQLHRIKRAIAEAWKEQLAQVPPTVVINGKITQNVEAGGRGDIGDKLTIHPKIQVPAGAVLRTSVTVVGWRGLEARGPAQQLKQAVQVREPASISRASPRTRGSRCSTSSSGYSPPAPAFTASPRRASSERRARCASRASSRPARPHGRDQLPRLGSARKRPAALQNALDACPGEEVACRAGAHPDRAGRSLAWRGGRRRSSTTRRRATSIARSRIRQGKPLR